MLGKASQRRWSLGFVLRLNQGAVGNSIISGKGRKRLLKIAQILSASSIPVKSFRCCVHKGPDLPLTVGRKMEQCCPEHLRHSVLVPKSPLKWHRGGKMILHPFWTNRKLLFLRFDLKDTHLPSHRVNPALLNLSVSETPEAELIVL